MYYKLKRGGMQAWTCLILDRIKTVTKEGIVAWLTKAEPKFKAIMQGKVSLCLGTLQEARYIFKKW